MGTGHYFVQDKDGVHLSELVWITLWLVQTFKTIPRIGLSVNFEASYKYSQGF